MECRLDDNGKLSKYAMIGFFCVCARVFFLLIGLNDVTCIYFCFCVVLTGGGNVSISDINFSFNCDKECYVLSLSHVKVYYFVSY